VSKSILARMLRLRRQSLIGTSTGGLQSRLCYLQLGEVLRG
jgi:hypothetical protein